MAVLTLGELGGDELGGSALHDLLIEADHQLVVKLALAEQEARFEDCGADGHVRLGLADALVYGAGGVPDLEPHVPQAIEDRFGDLLAPGGPLVGKQKQEIDVRTWRQDATPIAAGR